MSTELTRAKLKENRTLIDIKELKPWDQNPREVLDKERVRKDMQGAQTVPLLVMSDGTILGGNSRYEGMVANKKELVWVSVIEFEEESNYVVAYINGERDMYNFKSVHDAKIHYALKNNAEYAKYLQAEVIEITMDSTLPMDDYVVRNDDNDIVSVKDLLDESNGIEVNSISDTNAVSKENKKDPKISYNVSFDYSLVKSTSLQDFETWLSDKADDMMLTMLDKFSEAKGHVE